MTDESLVEVLRAHLARRGLVICKTSTSFPLAPVDGFEEAQLLRGIVEVIDDAVNVLEWAEDDITTPVPSEVLAALARLS